MKKLLTILLLSLVSCNDNSMISAYGIFDAKILLVQPQSAIHNARTYVTDEHGHDTMLTGVLGRPGDIIKVRCYYQYSKYTGERVYHNRLEKIK